MNKAFLWGVATSHYQHEGGFNSSGLPRNNWSEWERIGRVEKSGRSVDFWNRFEEDFGLAAAIGLNAFRMSISWERLQASPHSLLDVQALDHYAEMLQAARQRGLEPLLTLHHFTHPEWLGQDIWLQPQTPTRFEQFATSALESLNTRLIAKGQAPVSWIVTINEPNMLAINTHLSSSFPGGRKRGPHALAAAIVGMLLAHIQSWHSIHTLYAQRGWPRPHVSLNTYASDLYWLDGVLTDLLYAPRLGIGRSDVVDWLHTRRESFESQMQSAGLAMRSAATSQIGHALKKIQHAFVSYLLPHQMLEPLFHLLYPLFEETECVPLDYVGIDYYDPFAGHVVRLPRFTDLFPRPATLRDWMIQSLTSKWWDWRHLPDGLAFFCRRIARDLPGLPILITENGMAHRQKAPGLPRWRRDALTRADFLRNHLAVVRTLRREKIPLAGYFHWSLTDNYEWGSYAPRFGLYRVESASPHLLRQAAEDDATAVLAQAIREAHVEESTPT